MRRYKAQLWASTNITDESFDEAGQTGFDRLFAYINGSNAENKAIPMTCPVLNYVMPDADGRKTVYKISFYVPYDYQPPNKGPPKPTDPTVFIETIADMEVGVIGFGGYSNEQEDEEYVKKIEKGLQQDNIKY